MAPSATSTAAATAAANGNGNPITKPVPVPRTPSAQLSPLDASKLVYERTKTPRPVPSIASANAGDETICTDHMVSATWHASTGWSAPRLHPYGPLSLMPTASVLHYATECFEGLKVYRGYDGKLRLFRPDCNARRMLMSSVRISLPSFDPKELEKLIVALMAVDGPRWLPRDDPDRRGTFMYLRPSMIGTQSQLGVMASREAMLFVICSFMPTLHSPPGGMRLKTNPDDMIRAWAGGFGYAKVGANYGPSLLATNAAREEGFHQILWLYGPEGLCTEAGASNFFVMWRAKEDPSKLQLVTAPLDDKIILDGVTRRSVLELVRDRCPEVDVVERKYTIDELVEAYDDGRLVECFAAGTAFFICPVSVVHHRGKDVKAPMGEGEGAEYTLRIRKWLMDIMYGNEDHPWAVVIPEEE